MGREFNSHRLHFKEGYTISYCEDIFEESLKLVLNKNISFVRNYRPNFLKNKTTGRNLEIDFYIPSCKLGIEIHGEHHYNDNYQIKKDNLKRKFIQNNKCHLIELSIFQIDPPAVYRKLMAFSRENKIFVGVKKFDPKWIKHKKKTDQYKNIILQKYKNGKCVLPYHVNKNIMINKYLDEIINNFIRNRKCVNVDNKVGVIIENFKKYFLLKCKDDQHFISKRKIVNETNLLNLHKNKYGEEVVSFA